MAILTSTGGILAAEVAGLVATEEAGGLGLGSRTTGQTGVEVHHTLHTGSILSSTNGLQTPLAFVFAGEAQYSVSYIPRKRLRVETGRDGRQEYQGGVTRSE